MQDKCPKCGKIGTIILEKPRKRNQTKEPLRRSRTVLHGLGDWKKTEYSLISRIPGRYFRVHHYLMDKNDNYVRGKNGRPKSKFCYVGNFELAKKKLKEIILILNEYAVSKLNIVLEERKKNRLLVWNLEDLESFDTQYKKTTKIKIENLKPNDIDTIYKVIQNSHDFLVADNRVFVSSKAWFA